MQGGGQGGNRLEVRVRGNAHQLQEKYKQLARDAHQGGDRVAAEYYLQHADHYFRVLNDSRIRQEEMRARRGIFDPLDEEGEDEEGAEAESEAGRFDDRREARVPEERTGQPRFEDRRNSRAFEDRREPATDSGEARDPWNRNRDRPRRNRDDRPQDRTQDRSASVSLSDGEAALVAFGGRPADTPLAPAPEAAPAPGAEAADPGEPRPRRRTRTRRATEAEPIEG
jgi:hypothetical protein